MSGVIKSNNIDYDKITKILRLGGVIIYPTDTAYALGADVANTRAIKKIFKIKKRDKGKTLPLIVSDFEMANYYASFSDKSREMANRYWPGPLTLVLPAKAEALPRPVMRQGYIALRVPNNEIARRISKNLGKAIVSTSANISGTDNLYDIEKVKKSIADKADLIVAAGHLPSADVSTMVKVNQDGSLQTLREGAVDLQI